MSLHPTSAPGGWGGALDHLLDCLSPLRLLASPVMGSDRLRHGSSALVERRAHRYCSACGAGLPRTAPGGERKLVTVLFADIKDSMELLAFREPEEARQLLDPALELMMQAVRHFGGVVNQVMGDGIMSLFGAPLALEDHAVRACRAALLMQKLLRAYSRRMAARSGMPPIQIRIGLNSGVVVVRSIRGDLDVNYTAVGQPTHVAARMEQIARPGSAVFSGDMLRLVEDFVRVKPLGAVQVKGLAERIDAYELVGSRSARTAGGERARRRSGETSHLALV